MTQVSCTSLQPQFEGQTVVVVPDVVVDVDVLDVDVLVELDVVVELEVVVELVLQTTGAMYG
jgi:hypothetical protein